MCFSFLLIQFFNFIFKIFLVIRSAKLQPDYLLQLTMLFHFVLKTSITDSNDGIFFFSSLLVSDQISSFHSFISFLKIIKNFNIYIYIHNIYTIHYICICIYIYIYICTYTLTHKHTHMYSYAYMCVYSICICTCTYIDNHIYFYCNTKRE